MRIGRARGRETFVPLSHPPGHAQVDFGEAVGVIGGVRQKLHFSCMDLPQSDACFVKAYPCETTETFLDDHVAGFAFFGGVPLSILYDNLKIAVAKICGDGKRERTRAFTELISHYLFADRFGRPGNDKGKVEGLVKYARANFMTPIPEAASFDALNAMLAECCRARQGGRAGRHAATIGERLAADLAVLRGLSAVPLESCGEPRPRHQVHLQRGGVFGHPRVNRRTGQITPLACKASISLGSSPSMPRKISLLWAPSAGPSQRTVPGVSPRRGSGAAVSSR